MTNSKVDQQHYLRDLLPSCVVIVNHHHHHYKPQQQHHQQQQTPEFPGSVTKGLRGRRYTAPENQTRQTTNGGQAAQVAED